MHVEHTPLRFRCTPTRYRPPPPPADLQHRGLGRLAAHPHGGAAGALRRLLALRGGGRGEGEGEELEGGRVRTGSQASARRAHEEGVRGVMARFAVCSTRRALPPRPAVGPVHCPLVKASPRLQPLPDSKTSSRPSEGQARRQQKPQTAP